MLSVPQQSPGPVSGGADRWRRALLRLLTMTLLWWLLTEGESASWYLGVPAVLLATAASLRGSGTSRYRVRPLAALPFAWRFLRSSLRAGLDVARRTLTPSLPLDPVLVRIRLALPPGLPRWLLATVMTLVPGSLTVSVRGESILLHSLDRKLDLEREVRMWERLIANLFGLPLPQDSARTGPAGITADPTNEE